MNPIYQWINENRAVWFIGVIGFVLGIRLGMHFFINPNHIYTLHDILWGYPASNLPSLLLALLK